MLRLALAAWFILFLFATTWPWRDVQGHAHWERLNWVPFGGATDGPRDMALNALLFLPLGYLYARQSARPRATAIARAVVAALVLSASAELLQVFMHNHFPTATDVVIDVIGALWGALLGRMERATGIEPV